MFDAAFRRTGIQRVATLMHMLEAAETLAHARPLHGEALALVTNGGGMGVLAADQLLAAGGQLARLGDATLSALDAALPAAWSHANPVDIIGDAGPDRYRAALEVLLGAPEVNAVAVMYCPTGLGEPAAAADGVLAELRKHPAHVPVMASWLGPVAAAAARKPFAELGIPNFDAPEALVRGFMQLATRCRQQIHLSKTVPAFPLRGDSQRGEVRQLIDGWLRDGVDWLRLAPVNGYQLAERVARGPSRPYSTLRDMAIANPIPTICECCSRDARRSYSHPRIAPMPRRQGKAGRAQDEKHGWKCRIERPAKGARRKSSRLLGG